MLTLFFFLITLSANSYVSTKKFHKLSQQFEILPGLENQATWKMCTASIETACEMEVCFMQYNIEITWFQEDRLCA